MTEQHRKKVLLFYNPYSGNGTFRHELDVIIGKFQAKRLQIIPIRSERGRIIDEFFASIKPEEYREVLVAGGDGTINLCVNAMMRQNISLPIAIFPVGTANDFAHYFQLPQDVAQMTEIALGNHLSTADIGVCNQRYFINVAAMGALVDVSQKTDPNLKNTLGVLSYYLRALGELPAMKPLPVRIITEDRIYDEEMFFMVVMNGTSAGGFKNVSPESDINDGLLNVVLFRKMPVVEFGPLLLSVLQGKHPKNKHVLTLETDHLRVESDADISTDVDGEKGETFPLEFRVLPRQLKLFTPGRKGEEK